MEEEVIGFIDHEGIFYPCKYGEHSLLAYKLAKKLFKDDEESTKRKVEFGLVRIMRLGYHKNSSYQIFLPRSFNEKQKITLEKIKNNTNLEGLKGCIEYVFERLIDYKEEFEEKKDVFEKGYVSYLEDQFDYGITESYFLKE